MIAMAIYFFLVMAKNLLNCVENYLTISVAIEPLTGDRLYSTTEPFGRSVIVHLIIGIRSGIPAAGSPTDRQDCAAEFTVRTI
jgi:hypothetical protein